MRSRPSAASRVRRARAMLRSAALTADSARSTSTRVVSPASKKSRASRSRSRARAHGLLLDPHQLLASHRLDVVRGRAQQDLVLRAPHALLGRAHSFLRLLIGALLAQAREDGLLHGEAHVPVVERQDDALEVGAPERDLLAVADEAAGRPQAGQDVREVRPPLGVGRVHLGARPAHARVGVEGPPQGLLEGEGRARRGERRLGARERGGGERRPRRSTRRGRAVSRSPPGAEPVQKQVHDPLHVLLR